MKQLFLVVFLLGNTLLAFSQASSKQITLTILDWVKEEPIETATAEINGKAYAAFSDEKGKLSLPFAKTDTLIVSHIAYISDTFLFAELKQIDFIIRLEEQGLSTKELVILANKRKQFRSELARQITSISSEDIQLQNPQTTADLLQASGMVYVQKSQMGGGSPMIRGFAANRVMLAVDGVRMNNAIFRGGNLQNVISLDANSIENTEVVYGPGSLVYGSDALGGVMDFQTLSAKADSGTSLKISGNALLRYASANQEKTGHIDLNFGNKKWAFLSSLTLSDYGDLRMGADGRDEYLRKEYVMQVAGRDQIVENADPLVQKFTGYNQYNFMQKVYFKASDSLTFKYAFHISATSDVPRYDRLIQRKGEQLKYAEWYYGPQRWAMHHLSANLKSRSKLFDQLNLSLAYQFFGESRHDRRLNKRGLREREEKVNALSLNLDFDKHIKKGLNLFYGGEIVRNDVNSTGKITLQRIDSSIAIQSRYPDGASWESYGAYAHFKYRTSPALLFHSGLRYNLTHIEAEFDKRFFRFPFDDINQKASAITGSAGMIWHPAKTWQVNTNFATAFRSPNLDDAAKIFDSSPGNVVVPNPDLAPEYAYTLETGFVHNNRKGFFAEFTIFYTWLQNAMVRRDFQFDGRDSILYDGQLSQVQALINAESARIYGVQFATRYQINEVLSTRLTYSWIQGNTSDGDAVRHIPPAYGSLAVTAKKGKFRLSISSDFNAELPFDKLALSERKKSELYATDENGKPFTPSWWTLDLKGNYHIAKHLRLQFGLDNILDKRYRTYSSGIVAAGRNALVALRLGF